MPGHTLCVEHCPAGSHGRIPCPLDPKHTVSADQLQKHLARCNSRPRLAGQPFYCRGVNSCDSPSDRDKDLSWSLLDPPEPMRSRIDEIVALVETLVPDSELQLEEEEEKDGDSFKAEIWPMMAAELVNVAERAATSLKSAKKPPRQQKASSVDDRMSLSSSAEDEEEETGDGEEADEPRAVTNLRQQANLLSLAEKCNLLRSPCAYVEFGAGKGHLCHWVARYWSKADGAESVDPNAYLLIDRGSVRNKLDCAHKYSGERFARIRIDIADLALRPLLVLSPVAGALNPVEGSVGGTVRASASPVIQDKVNSKPTSVTNGHNKLVAKETNDNEPVTKTTIDNESVAKETVDNKPIAKETVDNESVAMATIDSELLAKETVDKQSVAKANIGNNTVSMATDVVKPVFQEGSANSKSFAQDSVAKESFKNSKPVRKVPVSMATSLANVPAAAKCGVTALGKHLCGAATDLALRCLAGLDDAADCANGNDGCSDSKRPRVTSAGGTAECRSEAAGADPLGPIGGVIALCCHHRCLWSAYVGKSYMASLGLGPEEFHAISRMAGWATCASKAERRRRQQQQDRRELVGLKCKRLIDAGRVAYLKEQLGCTARLLRYAKRSDTLENAALLFHRGI